MDTPRCMAQGDARILDPASLTLTRDEFGRLRLEIGIEERHEPVRAVRCLPLTDPDRFISLQDEEGEEIGLIEELRRLPKESRRILQEELELVYLNAEIQRIRRILPRQGIVAWEVETDRGPRTIYVKERSDIRPLGDGRIVVTDVHGAKFHIPSMDALDDQSRAWLEIEM